VYEIALKKILKLMENHIEETTQDVHGLDNLAPGAKKETEEILADINKEEEAKKAAELLKNGEKPPKSPEEIKAEEDAKKLADEQAAKKEEEDKKKADLEESQKKPRRESKLVPSYLLGIEKTEREKREKELLAEIELLKKGAKPDGDGSSEHKEIPKVEIKALVDKLVADNQIEDPKVIEDVFKAVEAFVNEKTKLPADVLEKLKTVDELKSQAEVAVEEANFNKDFDKDILPLIKAEYGDDIPVEKITEIKEKLKAIAYTPEYQKISYDEIYFGKKDFRGLHTPSKRSAEGSGSGASDLTKSTESFDKELSEEEYNALSPEDQQKYEDTMAKQERKRA
jgi:hypothetical protein